MRNEPDTDERLLLLAQIALEGVNLNAEVQAACRNSTLEAILHTTVYRRRRGLEPLQYVVRETRDGRQKLVYPAKGLVPCP